MAVYTGTPALPPLLPGDVPSGAADWAAIAAALHGLTDARTTYSPVWTSAGTAPVLGNGTLTGRYSQAGKLVTAEILLTAGSTTTFGTSAWFFSLPVTAVSATGGGGTWHGLQVGTNEFGGVIKVETATTIRCTISAGGFVQSTAPFTWANTHVLRAQVIYEAA